MKKLTGKRALILTVCSFVMAIGSLMLSIAISDMYYLIWFVINTVAGLSFLARYLTEWLEREPPTYPESGTIIWWK